MKKTLGLAIDDNSTSRTTTCATCGRVSCGDGYEENKTTRSRRRSWISVTLVVLGGVQPYVLLAINTWMNFH